MEVVDASCVDATKFKVVAMALSSYDLKLVLNFQQFTYSIGYGLIYLIMVIWILNAAKSRSLVLHFSKVKNAVFGA